jgi:5'(3')-deoxyribonucleotidase
MTSVFLDSDGVCADFDRGFPEIFGIDHRSIPEEEMWRLVAELPTFFDELPLMPDAEELFNGLRDYDPIILTACPKACFQAAAIAKKRWVRRHFGLHVRVLPVWGGKNKPLYMHQPGDILIDDWQDNITAWNAFGGTGILHLDAASSLEVARMSLAYDTDRAARRRVRE